jgi:ATPase subunit of ABC transporter with duplicated ATPase domains
MWPRWSAYTEAREREREGLNKALEGAKRERDSAIVDRAEQRARQEKRNRRGSEASARGGQAKILLGGRKNRAQVSTGKLDSALFERTNRAVRYINEAIKGLKIDPVMYADLIGQESPSQKLVAQAHGFNVRFRDWIYRDNLDFTWRGNVRIALKGANGSGKTTLLKAILGSHFKTRGELRGGNLATLYIDQRCASLDDKKSIFENVRDSSSSSESEIRNGLARFLFTNEAVFQKVHELSGGERLRAALARCFLSTTKSEL